MTDVKLAEVGAGGRGDLYWVDGLLGTVSADAEVLQQIWVVLSTGRGEWLFDTEAGFGYKQLVGQRGFDKVLIEGEVRRVLEPIVGADGIRAIELEHDPELKTLTITVDSVYGVTEVTVV